MASTPAPPPLLPSVAGGDPEAVRACLDRYGPLVWSLARRMCADPVLAEDLVQEIFIEVWRCAGRYEPELSSEAGFIATIARRRLIDAKRRAGRRPESEPLEEDPVGGPDERLERLEICEEAELAARAMETLDDVQRQVLLLSIQDGLSHSQIASSTKLPLGTVKSHIRRGLERVGRALRATGLDPAEGGAS